jgi:hypothetical protein
MVMPHLDKSSQLLDVFMLFFERVFCIIFEETKHYLQKDLAARDMPSASAVQDVRKKELLSFPGPYNLNG